MTGGSTASGNAARIASAGPTAEAAVWNVNAVFPKRATRR